jgi:hypothetical protein
MLQLEGQGQQIHAVFQVRALPDCRLLLAVAWQQRVLQLQTAQNPAALAPARFWRGCLAALICSASPQQRP